jgi:hypothetical protein
MKIPRLPQSTVGFDFLMDFIHTLTNNICGFLSGVMDEIPQVNVFSQPECIVDFGAHCFNPSIIPLYGTTFPSRVTTKETPGYVAWKEWILSATKKYASSGQSP